MCAERFGSYSIRSTTPTTPSLSRRKSMIRYFCLWPPPLWRVVIRPELLRAPVEFCDTSSGVKPLPLYRCERFGFVTKRVPGDVGRSLIIAMVWVLLSGSGLHGAGEVDGLAG